MSIAAILLPVFVEVLLIVVLAIIMGRRRFAAVQAGQVRREDVLLGERNWPAKAQAAANAYANQFELPVLFFALGPLAIATRQADLLFVALAWIFVVSRIVHAAVYVTSNTVPYRFGAFALGAFVLLLMWVVFAIRILSTSLPA